MTKPKRADGILSFGPTPVCILSLLVFAGFQIANAKYQKKQLCR